MFYHGSDKSDILVLEPDMSADGSGKVYFTDNEVLAAIYSVKPVKAPYHWYPYGFDENGVVVYSEYYPDALADCYKGKTGYIYICESRMALFPVEGITGAFYSELAVRVAQAEAVYDVYEKLLEYEKDGRLKIIRYNEADEKQKEFYRHQVLEEIKSNHLLENPESDYAVFIKERFPEVWREYEKLVQ